ncbi:hypothetical protein AAY473_034433 [Plecturocebus cupreus]
MQAIQQAQALQLTNRHHLCLAMLIHLYGRPLAIESDRETLFTGQQVQQWTTGTTMGTANGHKGWSSRLDLVLLTLNEWPQKGSPAPVEVLLRWATIPSQLLIHTKDDLLRPGIGTNGNLLLPTPASLKAGEQKAGEQNGHLSVAMDPPSPHC